MKQRRPCIIQLIQNFMLTELNFESQLFVYWKCRKFEEAYWRAARASLHLDLCRNGIDFCDAGLEHASSCQQDSGPVDPNNEK